MAFQKRYFPPFDQLPCMDENPVGEAGYYHEFDNGVCHPNRTWCFMAEIVNDALSSSEEFGHRVEVRDMAGTVRSVLFFPLGGHLDFSELKKGSTLFVRYAHRFFFSDLSTEAVKVEDLNFVKVIGLDLDTLLYVAQAHFEAREACLGCGTSLVAVGGSASSCAQCTPATAYCSPACRDAAAPAHATYCAVCRDLSDVLNLNFDTFMDFVPFRRTAGGFVTE